MEKNIRIVSRNIDYGRLGEYTGRKAFVNGISGRTHKIRVGDIVCYEKDGKTFSAVVLKKGNRYGLMGRGIDNLFYSKMTISIPYNHVSAEMINALHDMGYRGFEFVEEEVEEMTMEDIEKALGKRVKIVKERI